MYRNVHVNGLDSSVNAKTRNIMKCSVTSVSFTRFFNGAGERISVEHALLYEGIETRRPPGVINVGLHDRPTIELTEDSIGPSCCMLTAYQNNDRADKQICTTCRFRTTTCSSVSVCLSVCLFGVSVICLRAYLGNQTYQML